MNNTSQIGITIAGVAVVSAIAAVVFNKLNVEPRLSSGSNFSQQFAEPRLSRGANFARQFAEEKAEDNYPGYESDEGVDPPRRPIPNAPVRPSFQPNFDDSQSRGASAQRESNDLDDFDIDDSPEPSSSFQQKFPSQSSSGLSNDLSRESSFVSASGSSPGSVSGPNQEPGSGPVQAPVQAPGPSMIGGTKYTRCKHCYSRLKYTRRK